MWHIIAQDGRDGQDLTIGPLPSTPTGFAVVGVSTASSVTLQWNPSMNGENYQVLIADTRGGPYDPVQVVHITYNRTQAKVTGLTMNRTYWFKVYAINS
jgi:hypothetical protein